MQAFDASSMIYAWDNYPIQQFPGLWDWMAAQVQAGDLVMSRIAFEEVVHKVPECGAWLKEQDIDPLDVSNEITLEALAIKGLLGVANDRYHPEGVGENDLFIIATARIRGIELISDENKQPTLPQNLSKYKIPAVCGMPQVGVPCASFVEFMKRSNQIFR